MLDTVKIYKFYEITFAKSIFIEFEMINFYSKDFVKVFLKF